MTAPRIVEEEAWVEHAACKGLEDADAIFFPVVRRGENSRYAYRRARLVCAVCPVRDECLAFAISEPEPQRWGMWGGKTPKERQRLRGYKG